MCLCSTSHKFFGENVQGGPLSEMKVVVNVSRLYDLVGNVYRANEIDSKIYDCNFGGRPHSWSYQYLVPIEPSLQLHFPFSVHS